MLACSVLHRLRNIAAGLVLLLGGCRSTAVTPRFAPAAYSFTQRPVTRLDTTLAAAPERSTAPPRPAKRGARPRAVYSLNERPLEKKGQAPQSNRSYPTTTTADTAKNSARAATPRELGKPLPKLVSAKTLVHYSLHFVFPVVLALVFFPAMWQTAYLIMLATMLIDLDHLLATPVFDPLRCSIGFHPLHSFYAIPVYVLLLLLPPPMNVIAVGVLFHLFTDTVDCLWSFRYCRECYLNSRIRGLVDWARKLLGLEVVR
ncbi:DUF6122 family protein [Hymenobacter latericus]|uniref:DUF6122 family protein n=1 Tax=Hymenobacter sp. YIM 151858-1 TaxID=2987688 RepID=UPI0022276EFA|nr:DUF6122 family protein [Hymenobacter sp. YIM 151858-1]UYZ61352.1 DUF6122 family protein [Hymenobacter sp. YIM 151858-1]